MALLGKNWFALAADADIKLISRRLYHRLVETAIQALLATQQCDHDG